MAQYNPGGSSNSSSGSSSSSSDSNSLSTTAPAPEPEPKPEPTQSNPYVDENGNGLIKGSNSKIYHVPGSQYYDRTTNPAEMFKSIEEAEAAGYRAPK